MNTTTLPESWQKLADDKELLSAVQELESRGYFVFIGHPHTDFDPDKVDLSDIYDGLNIAFNEAVEMHTEDGEDEDPEGD